MSRSISGQLIMGFSLANAVRRYYWDCLSQCSSNFPTRATGRCRPCRLADAGTGSFLDIHQPPLHCSGPALDSVDWLNRNGHACRADLIDLGLNDRADSRQRTSVVRVAQQEATRAGILTPQITQRFQTLRIRSRLKRSCETFATRHLGLR